MKNFEQKLLDELNQNKNVILVGKSGTGKTFFVKNKLIPFLNRYFKQITYFEDCNQITSNIYNDLTIIDEVELLNDQNFLQKLYLDEQPY